MLNIALRDAALQPLLTEVSPLSLEWKRIHNAGSGWELAAPTDSVLAEALRTPDVGVVVTDTDTGVVLMSGVSEVSTPDAPAVERTIGLEDGSLVDATLFSGVTDTTQLADRIVVPPTGAAYDSRSGAAGTLIAGIVSDQAGPSGRAPITGLTVPSSSVGTSISTQLRYDSLLDACTDLGLRGGVGFRVVYRDRGLVLDIWETRDRTGDVLYSVTNANITNAKVATSVAEATRVFVAGQGEGAARTVVQVAASGGARIRERFLDRRDLANSGDLAEAGEAYLTEAAGQTALELGLLADSGAIYGVDFGLGDLVSVDLGAQRLAVQVTSETCSIGIDGALTRSIGVGAPRSYGVAALLRSNSTTSRRVSRLERI